MKIGKNSKAARFVGGKIPPMSRMFELGGRKYLAVLSSRQTFTHEVGNVIIKGAPVGLREEIRQWALSIFRKSVVHVYARKG